MNADQLLRNVPPHDATAERAVLGSVLLDPLALDLVRPKLAGADFYCGPHAAVWSALCALRDADRPLDVVTLHGELERRPLHEPFPLVGKQGLWRLSVGQEREVVRLAGGA